MLESHRVRVGIAAATLVALALGLAIAWRLEIEWSMSGGLGWIWDTHYVFYAGIAAFTLWIPIAIRFAHRLSWRRVPLVAALVVPFAVFGAYAVPLLLVGVFGGWGGGLVSVALSTQPEILSEIAKNPPDSQILAHLTMIESLFWAAWLVPTVGLWLVLRVCGLRSRIWSLPLSGILQFWAFPLAVWALALVTAHRGDIFEAIRSGFVIPIFVIAVGIPVLVARPYDPADPSLWQSVRALFGRGIMRP